MRRWWMSFLAVLLTGCATASGNVSNAPASGSGLPLPDAGQANAPESEQPLRADLPDLGPAPELTNQVWLNTDEPLRLEDLRGKVVLLDMWTFG